MRQFICHYSNMKQLWWNKDKIPLRTTPINFHLYLLGNIKQCLAEWVWVIKWRAKRHKLQTYSWDFVMASGRGNKMFHNTKCKFVCLINKRKKVTPSAQNTICLYLVQIALKRVIQLKNYIGNCARACTPPKGSCKELAWIFFYSVRILNVTKVTRCIKCWTFYSAWEFYVFSLMPTNFL